MNEYKLAVIGGGPAGYAAALEAVQYGCSVVLFEKDNLGGTCLNRGCVPTKFLAHTAELYDGTKRAALHGIFCEGIRMDYPVMHGKMQETVEGLRIGLEQLFLQKKIDIVTGSARLVSSHQIVCGSVSYHADYILLATGAVPAKPVVKGAWNSDKILQSNKLPHSIHVIGGGAVAVEFASIMNKLGSSVTISIRGERVLRKWDRELAVSMTQLLKKRGIRIRTNCSQEEFEEAGYDVVLSAVGRKPNREGLEMLPLSVDQHGAILVDEFGATNIEHIYAAGDVTAQSPMLAHTAMEQGRRVAQHITGHKLSPVSCVAACIYTNPEIASIGMTEKKAKELGREVVVGKQNMYNNACVRIAADERSFMKVVADKNTHMILGAQLMCEHASDIASEFVLAINRDLTVEDLLQAVHPHPSFSETVMDVMGVLEEKLHEISVY